MYIEFQNNPCGRRVGDCAVRALSKALDTTWESAYLMLALNGLQMCDMPSSDSVLGSVLRQNGFEKESTADIVPGLLYGRRILQGVPNGDIRVVFWRARGVRKRWRHAL